MRVVHLLRKYNPREWGGTETAMQRLLAGLRPAGVENTIYAPALRDPSGRDPLKEAGHCIKRFHACVPVLGISQREKQQWISVGGNLMSFDLPALLWRERDLDVVHAHTSGRIGGIGLSLAKYRHIPFVITIHGGVLDLPDTLKQSLNQPRIRGWEWGKIFGALVQSRRVFPDADAILTCNPNEAALLRRKFPNKRIQVQPHGVPISLFEPDHRDAALDAFPVIRDKKVLLSLGRLDPVKNQAWLLERAPSIFLRHPDAMLVLAGACTDPGYGELLQRRIQELGLEQRVLLTGGVEPGDPRLVGLMQLAKVLVLPSISETFGLVLLEAWAAGIPVVSSRTSGGAALVKDGENGWLFDLANPQGFHEAIDQTLVNPELARQWAAAGRRLAIEQYDVHVLARRLKDLYQDLCREMREARHRQRPMAEAAVTTP